MFGARQWHHEEEGVPLWPLYIRLMLERAAPPDYHQYQHRSRAHVRAIRFSER
jgi:hypothetical protein